jgi:uncharacterized protein (TIGR02569 family)
MVAHTEDAWRVGSAALKRVDHHDAVEWVSGLLASRDSGEGFRLPHPIPAKNGSWIVDGWSASTWLSGEEDGSRWRQILQTGELFHDWLADVERPAWLDEIDDPWRRSDHAAWGEQPADVGAEFVHLIEELTAMRQPVSAKSQLVHGDLTGNVLFSEGMAPGIIDLSLYWRPPGYAAAIGAVDCFEWESVGTEALDRAAARADGQQLLVRAALFRIIRSGMDYPANPEPRLDVHRRTVSAIRARIT